MGDLNCVLDQALDRHPPGPSWEWLPPYSVSEIHGRSGVDRPVALLTPHDEAVLMLFENIQFPV